MILQLFRGLQTEISDLYKFRLVTLSFVTSTLKMRYKKSIIGVFWSLLGPALNYLIVGFVFSHISKVNTESYFLFLFSGAAIYNLMAAIINQSPGIMLNNEHFIKKIYLPKAIFILNQVLMEFINFLIGITVLLVLGVLFQKITFNAAMLTLPITILLALMFAAGVCSILSIGTVFFRDFIHLIPLVMQAIFFGTPVLYEISMVPERFRQFTMMNPLYHFVECFRYPIYHMELPPAHSFIFILIAAPVSLLLGAITVKVFDNKIVFKL